MASDNQANFAKIGFFVLAGIALIAGVIVYLGSVGAARHEFLAETFFSNSVSGLDIGSAVNFRGVRVGAVKRISFIGAEYENVADVKDNRNIYVEIALDARLFRFNPAGRPQDALERLVERGLHATVTASGVTGLSRLELNMPKVRIEDEKFSWKPRHILIPPAPSLFDSAADSASKILGQLNQMDFVTAWSNIVGVTANAELLLSSVNTLLGSQQGNIAQILDGLRDASDNLRVFSAEIKDNPSLLLRSGDPARLDETR